MTSGQKVACYHLGQDFDWWRCNVEGWVGRPPSPFPASFEHAHLYRESSAEARACGPVTLCCQSACCGTECKCAASGQEMDEATRRLYWPLCQGPELTPMLDTTDLGDNNLNGLTNGGKKSPRRSHKRPPWCPAKMPNKWGVAGHPPPYTNYCKETLFNTRTADPQKVTIKTTF
ncbi:hypothetical protein Bpfe_022788 [Biomphalaria pfeifferi]|nr:hypothetical protein BgiBS90_021463 [Biomphalaria glabrata]KAK0047748.1 hypothetical protein Bpfe_022788 [Biomphalaria pfeifferi]